ncbi:MAG: HEPN domain protein [Candidatus Nomurabacteria bacterium GW2011_GWB1_37_5]|uniref:HEPN domain protein n=1 Tax=Candidatus Nomurabacteria bacterium GW2011_GWB1_37_5 TaxID=1618742 RepID=A0A0G0JBX8_9BACT|nr:MAG: HEPN domain protein [Candidatus Nomurabacteria bacterium GW2011_GWB1_37_5]
MIAYWRKSAQEAKEAAYDNFRSGHPDWGFFLWHLAIEKLLKGILIKKGLIPPPVHDLEKLSLTAKLTLDQKQRAWLSEITSYNINARYDDYKRQFYKKVTQDDYATKWQKICEDFYLWLEKKY